MTIIQGHHKPADKMTVKKRLPDFFVVGAQKAGTTSLHEWLTKLSAVALPTLKETHFFRDKERFDRGVEWYLDQFDWKKDSKVVGEIDPEYMFFPECAQRMQSLSIKPKLLFVLREPIARAYSHYLMSQRRGYENLSFAEALSAEDERLKQLDNRFSMIHHSYLGRSLYSSQIDYMMKCFPDSDVMFVLFDDLFNESRGLEVFKQICFFIGLSRNEIDISVIDPKDRSNQAVEPRSLALRNFLYRKSLLKHTAGKLIPSRTLKIMIFKTIELLNLRPSKRGNPGNIAAQVPTRVIEMILEDIRRVERLTGFDLRCWDQRPAESL